MERLEKTFEIIDLKESASENSAEMTPVMYAYCGIIMLAIIVIIVFFCYCGFCKIRKESDHRDVIYITDRNDLL